LLSQALKDAVRFDMTVRNVAGKDGQTAFRMSTEEMLIIPKNKISDIIAGLRGRAMYAKAITALFTGLRRGELLALRWPHMNFDTKILEVREALEGTKAHGLRFRATKTKSGRRDIELPDMVVDALREYRREQLELRFAMGLGKLTDDALIFPARDGGPQSPRNLSGDWLAAARAIGLGDIGFHSLRHTHASMLIAGKIDIVRISKRPGHSKPGIKLAIYSHLFEERDEQSAAVINATLAQIVRY
jgi:integrase